MHSGVMKYLLWLTVQLALFSRLTAPKTFVSVVYITSFQKQAVTINRITVFDFVCLVWILLAHCSIRQFFFPQPLWDRDKPSKTCIFSLFLGSQFLFCLCWVHGNAKASETRAEPGCRPHQHFVWQSKLYSCTDRSEEIMRQCRGGASLSVFLNV